MARWPVWWFGLVRLVLVATFGVTGLLVPGTPARASQSAETTYTSPNFGYSIAWPLPWYVSSEGVDSGYDMLELSDDQSSVQFSGTRFGDVTAQQAAMSVVDSLREDPTNANVAVLDKSSCPFQSNGAVVCYRYDVTLGEGPAVGVTGVIEARSLGDGLILLMIAGVREPHLAEYLPKWSSFEVAAPAAPLPEIAANRDWQVVSYGDATYRIQPGVPDLDRDLAVEGIEYARRTVAAMTGSWSKDPLSVTVLSSAYPLDSTQYGLTRGSGIWIYTGSDSWPTISPIERLQGLVHEYFHLYQFDRLSTVDTEVPAWFLEGSAEAFGYLAVSQFGITDQMDFVELGLFRLEANPVSGSLCEYVDDDETFPFEIYSLAYLAVQDLLARNGESVDALVDIFTQIGNGATFEAAFAETFQTDLVSFCAGEPGWRATLAPVDDIPPDLAVYQGKDLPGAVRIAVIPARVRPGQQILITAVTSAGANCQLTASFHGGVRQLRQETFANGSGEAFWLMIVPEGTLPGDAVASIDCGANVVRQPFSVS
ncbi:MAG TPA: hypothetical protein VFP05_01185 [Thermomicrobiales bacterium]|nr:hypothetical protein [Thermomicrobiales bacterium]